jgi:hypothetical protein
MTDLKSSVPIWLRSALVERDVGATHDVHQNVRNPQTRTA